MVAIHCGSISIVLRTDTHGMMLELRNYEYNMLEAMNICICYEYICHSYITVRVGYLLLLHESDRGEAEGES